MSLQGLLEELSWRSWIVFNLVCSLLLTASYGYQTDLRLDPIKQFCRKTSKAILGYSKFQMHFILQTLQYIPV